MEIDKAKQEKWKNLLHEFERKHWEVKTEEQNLKCIEYIQKRID